MAAEMTERDEVTLYLLAVWRHAKVYQVRRDLLADGLERARRADPDLAAAVRACLRSRAIFERREPVVVVPMRPRRARGS